MLSNQLKDVESWAGKGSKGASTAEARRGWASRWVMAALGPLMYLVTVEAAAAMTAKAPQASSQAGLQQSF